MSVLYCVDFLKHRHQQFLQLSPASVVFSFYNCENMAGPVKAIRGEFNSRASKPQQQHGKTTRDTGLVGLCFMLVQLLMTHEIISCKFSLSIRVMDLKMYQMPM